MLLVFAPAGQAQVPFRDADFAAYAHGATAHADLISSGTSRLVDVEEAFSSAVVNSRGLGTRTVTENNLIAQPELPDKNSYARGSGLELGVNESLPLVNNDTILAQKAERSALPNLDTDTREIAPTLDPVVYASTLRGQASAFWDRDFCPLNRDLSRGLGYAENLQLLDLGGNTRQPNLDNPVFASDIITGTARAVGQSLSRTRLVPQTNRPTGTVIAPNFGLMSEVRETIAPVTLLRTNTGETLRLEIGGEWVLRAVANGLPGGAYIHYGPGTVSPQTPVVRISGPVNQDVFLQTITGATGLVIPLPGGGEIAIGEDPRAIHAPNAAPNAASQPQVAADGTSASAAVDVVRVRFPGVEDIRIGHMEVSTRVPEGGIICGIKIDKTANPEFVQAGDEFTYTITVTNPPAFNCVLTNVRVVDTPRVEGQVRYTILSQSPPANEVTPDNVMIWNDIGPIPSGESRELKIQVKVLENSGAGRFINNAVVTSDCGMDTAEGRRNVGVPLRGEVEIPLPRVGRPLPLTGGPTKWYLLAAMSLVGVAGVSLAMRKRLLAVPPTTGT